MATMAATPVLAMAIRFIREVLLQVGCHICQPAPLMEVMVLGPAEILMHQAMRLMLKAIVPTNNCIT